MITHCFPPRPLTDRAPLTVANWIRAEFTVASCAHCRGFLAVMVGPPRCHCPCARAVEHVERASLACILVAWLLWFVAWATLRELRALVASYVGAIQ